MTKEKTHALNIRLETEYYEKLKQVAEKQERPVANLAKLAIKKYLDETK